ncbi:TFIID-domain-containing protein [Fomitopsis betulina]|nr:TFIID-domain-containing protein [Fomitopsis betulina]
MSYYSPHAGAGYPYTSYPNYPQTPGAYPTTPYSTYPATGVTGYGAAWPYQAYSYYAHPQQQQQQQPAASTTAKPTATTSTFSVTPTVTTPAPPRAPPAQYTFAQTYTPSSTGLTATRSSKKQPTFKGLFAKELRNLMYGFGDDRNPANDTVNVMEEILVEYIVDVCQTALAPGKNKGRLSIEDLRRALSRPADAKKLARMEELLFMQEDIKRARAQFEESDMNQATTF